MLIMIVISMQVLSDLERSVCRMVHRQVRVSLLSWDSSSMPFALIFLFSADEKKNFILSYLLIIIFCRFSYFKKKFAIVLLRSRDSPAAIFSVLV